MIEDIRKIAKRYYLRRDIQKALASEAKSREIVPRYLDQFGKRPDVVNYENDVAALANKGATSFHCSEELWHNPLELSTEMTQKEASELRKGWDLILDIDCKFIEYSKAVAELLIEALKFHNIKNIGLKFSGGSGFHIGLAFDAFPAKLNDLSIKDFFPEGPRIIASYLKELIAKPLAQKILELNTLEEISKVTNKPLSNLLVNDNFNPFSILEIDTVLISSRHLFRMPYSLHERTGLASIVIRPSQLKAFHPGWAIPHRVLPKPFLPKPERNEAKELLMQALDWHARIQSRERQRGGQLYGAEGGKQKQIVILKNIAQELYPPCIKKALAGMREDGRKRCLFILINFLRSLSLSMEDVEKKVEEWNKLNYKPLQRGYIVAQLDWYKNHKVMPPPNCDKSYYRDIGLCNPDFFCTKIKNPLSYISKRLRLLKEQEGEAGQKAKKKRQRRTNAEAARYKKTKEF